VPLDGVGIKWQHLPHRVFLTRVVHILINTKELSIKNGRRHDMKSMQMNGQRCGTQIDKKKRVVKRACYTLPHSLHQAPPANGSLPPSVFSEPVAGAGTVAAPEVASGSAGSAATLAATLASPLARAASWQHRTGVPEAAPPTVEAAPPSSPATAAAPFRDAFEF
jgi:hypothetical protein